ncbi:hypothetical protein DFH94DRAFT_759117, partial [Russula ochroleuca]
MPTPTPTPDLVLGDTRTRYPRTCACVPTCWVTTCTRTRWGARVRVGRHAYALGRARVRVGARAYALGARTRTRWGVRVRVRGCAFVFGGARSCSGARVRFGRCAFMLGGAHTCWGARSCSCSGGRARALGGMRTRTYSLYR